MNTQLLQQLPSVERLTTTIRDQYGDVHDVTGIARDAIARVRMDILSGLTDKDIQQACLGYASVFLEMLMAQQVTVVNATGILLHTNLGRAVLSQAAKDALVQAAESCVDVELDLLPGGRGDRYGNSERMLRHLTSASAAMVVNNNAAATLLAVTVLGQGQNVIISRGELVEIGGNFRMPDVIRASGSKLVEVGSTNRTHASDYVNALSSGGGCIIRCHQSNFVMHGFVSAVASCELADIARKHGVPYGEDLGAGALVDFKQFGIDGIPTVGDVVAGGADLVWFSGDKLLGGPQAGILVGTTEWIHACKIHPLARALRPDKLTLAALEATLAAYLEGKLRDIPLLDALSYTLEELVERATQVLENTSFDPQHTVSITSSVCALGAGSAPDVTVPSIAIKIETNEPHTVATCLRVTEPHVLATIRGKAVTLDMRSIRPSDVQRLQAAIQHALA